MGVFKQILDELIDCYDDNELDHDYFLNVVTGEIVFLAKDIQILRNSSKPLALPLIQG